MTEGAKDMLIFPLDVDGLDEARDWVKELKDHVGAFKIGFELFLREGPRAVEMVREEGRRVFLDLKFHDIPNTVARASAQAVKMGVFMFNVHASGGTEMMKAAARAASEEAAGAGVETPLLIAVTVLTSLDGEALKKAGFIDAPEKQVERLCLLARDSGLAGVVSSAREATRIRELAGPEFKIVCPGVRPAGAEAGDQKRVATPREAAAAGADFLVIGRPIREARDPREAARRILEDAEAGLNERAKA